MESNSMIKNLIFVLVLAAVLFLGYRWWMSRNAAVVSSKEVTTEVVTEPAPAPIEAAAAPVAEPVQQTAAAEQVEAPVTAQA